MSDPLQPAGLLHDLPWERRFDAETIDAGHTLAPKVRNLSLTQLEDDSLELRGEVQGQRTDAILWQGPDSWNLECSCSCDAGPLCAHGAAVLLRARREADRGRIPRKRIEAAIATALPRSTAAHPPPQPATPAEEPPPQPRLELHVSRGPVGPEMKRLLHALGQPDPGHWITATATANYEEHSRSLGPDPAAPEDAEAHHLPRHSPAAEKAARVHLAEAGLSSLRSNPSWRFLLGMRQHAADRPSPPDLWFPDPSRIPPDRFWHRFRGETIARLESLGWTVRVDESVGHDVIEPDPSHWENILEPQADGWFSLSVGFEVDGTRHDLLPILARLLEDGFLEDPLPHSHDGFLYAPLPDGKALKLPAERIRRILDHLAALLDPRFPSRCRIHRLDAAALGSATSLGTRCSDPDTPLPATIPDEGPPPAGLQASLREYQLAGLRWMRSLAQSGLHGILADDMGLGKTLQTLAFLLGEMERGAGLPSLVVAPTSVIPNWQAEARRFAPQLRVLTLDGPSRRDRMEDIPAAHLVLTSYALLHRDAQTLATHRFHTIVLDEAQHIKNPDAKVAQAARALTANHRFCLSGTPVENHLGELWSLMRFLEPGLLGSAERFNRHYRKPVEKDGDLQRLADLRSRLAPLILRRTKDEVARELPPKTFLLHHIDLHPSQKDLYETVRATMNRRVREALAARGNDGFQPVFLDALLKLRQICCDPRLLPPHLAGNTTESAKLDHLADLLDALLEQGRRVLLFSQFTSMLSLVGERLAAKGIRFLTLTGASRDRRELVERFQKGTDPLFLISLKAGGTGLNLTAADTVIHYDPWWNPAAEAQASDRAHRIGQTKPVFIHKLLCRNTVEERIHRMQLDKAQLAAVLPGLHPIPGGTPDQALIEALLGPEEPGTV